MIIKLTELMEQENDVELLEKILKTPQNKSFKDNMRKIIWEDNAKIFINYVMNNILFNTVSYHVDDLGYTFLCGEVTSSREEFELAFGEFLYEFDIDKSLVGNKLAAIDYLVNDTINHMLEINEMSQIILENSYIEDFYNDLEIDSETLITYSKKQINK